MNFNKTVRWAILLTALFPTFFGLLALLNNTSGFSDTVQYAVGPTIAMTDTYGNPAQTWRAITSPIIAQIALIVITLFEASAGVVGAIAMYKMLKTINQPFEQFQQAKSLLIISCTLAILVWGIGFAVIAGEFFLTWQSKTTIETQLGGLIYTIPCFLVMIFALCH
jgi:predicted small integral membrane protein